MSCNGLNSLEKFLLGKIYFSSLKVSREVWSQKVFPFWGRMEKLSEINVLFIPFFCLLVFRVFLTLVAWFYFSLFLSCLSCLVLQNVFNDYVIFSYFHNFIAKSDQKPKMTNGMNKTQIIYTRPIARHVARPVARSICSLILLFFYLLSFVVGTDFWVTSKCFSD